MSKVWMITGAGRGMGLDFAKAVLASGDKLVATGRNPERVAKAIGASENLLVTTLDVTKPADAVSAVNAVVERFGRIDVLVNNAGVMQLSSIAEADDANFDRQVSVNLKGTFNTLREAGKRLRNGGRIINFSTSVVGLKLENYGVYAATKAAVETLTAIMSKELRGRNITVNAVAPGPTATDLFLDGKSDELIARMAKMNPLERLGTPEDIAASVSFLAGSDGSWINGQVLRANGGMV